MNLSNYVRDLVRYSARLYFAAVAGAIKGIRSEYRSIDREDERILRDRRSCLRDGA
jgi:hypothetical protein